MPIVTSNNRVIYSRHEQAPRPKKTQDFESETASTTATTKGTPKATPATSDPGSLLRDFFFLVVLLLSIGIVMYNRDDGLLTTNNSVMHATSAESYATWAQSHIETVQYNHENTLPINTTDNTLIINTTDDDDSVVLNNNTCLTDDLVLIGSQVNVTFRVIAPVVDYIAPATTYQIENDNWIIAQSPNNKTIQFVVKELSHAIQTGSTFALLHAIVPDMCLNSSKIVNLTVSSDEVQQYIALHQPGNETISNTSSIQSDLGVETNRALLALFPTFIQSNVDAETTTKMSSLPVPLHIEVNVTQVMSNDAQKIAHSAEEQEKLKNGDFNAFIRALFGKINVIYLFVGYIGLRLGMLWMKRQKKHAVQEIIKNQPTPAAPAPSAE